LEPGPLASNNSLIITRNSIVVYNRTDIITSLQFLQKTEPELPTQHLDNVDILDNYFLMYTCTIGSYHPISSYL